MCQILTFLCFTPSNGSHVTESKSQSPYTILPRPTWPMILLLLLTPQLTPSQPHLLFLKHAPPSGPLHFIFPSSRALIFQVSHSSHSPFLWDLSLIRKAFSDHPLKNNIPRLLITLSLSISLSFFSWHFLSLNIHSFIYLLLSSPISMQTPESKGFLVFVHCCISSNVYGSWHKVGAECILWNE